MTRTVTIKKRRDSAADWTSENPTLAEGEEGYETDTGKSKVGDGTTVWTSLGYFSPNGASGVGDVVGPSSSTDNAIAIYDGITGKTIKNSPVTITATGSIVTTGLIDGIDVGTDVANNTTHRGSNGSDHSYLDQSVISGATPTFVGTSISSIGRGATFLVAASDANATVIAQADYVCDGTADDVQIQAAIDALPSAGGKVQLSEGKFNISATILTDKSDVYFDGMGFGTWLELDGSVEDDVLSFSHATRAYRIIISNMLVDGYRVGNSANKSCINVGNYDQVHINNVYVQQAYGSGINLSNCQYSSITDCFSKECGDDGIALIGGTKYTSVIGCTVMDTRGLVSAESCGIEVEDSCHNITLLGNKTFRTHSAGINVHHHNNGLQPYNVSIIGNIVNDPGETSAINDGIIVGKTGSPTGSITGVTIVGNTVNSAKGSGIFIRDASREVTISGNIVRNCSDWGIKIENTCGSITLTDNQCSDNGSGRISCSTSGNYIMSNIGFVSSFPSFPITPSAAPTTNYQVANKKYVDDNTINSVSEDTTPVLGGHLDMDSKYQFDNYTAGDAFAIRQIGYIDSIGSVSLATNQSVGSAKGRMIMALGTIAKGASGNFAKWGEVPGFTGLTRGSVYYLSNTLGSITTGSVQAAGSVSRILGYGGEATTKFDLEPSREWIVRG